MTYRVVLCHGVFDLLHAGHIHHLKLARNLGDRLVVSVVADKYLKHKSPVYPDYQRLAMLRELRCVSHVWLCNAPGPEKIIRALLPDLYVRGPDYRGKPMPERALLTKLGIRIRYTSEGPMRTSNAIEAIRCR